MYAARRWSVRHAGLMERLWHLTSRTLLTLEPVLRRIGLERLERPVAAVESAVKGVLFDCRMCGQCVLSETGMSCPMNCPKEIRNGPCGGVREGGYCEVVPEMRCVWVEGWEGARRMDGGAAIAEVQFAVDRRLQGSSSWLRHVRANTDAAIAAREAAGAAGAAATSGATVAATAPPGTPAGTAAPPAPAPAAAERNAA